MLYTDVKSHINRLKAKRATFDDGDQAEKAQKLLPFYIRIMTRLADCERCSVFINDPGQGKIWLKAGTGVDERDIEVPSEGSVVGDVITSGKPKVINNLEIKPGPHKKTDEKTGFITHNILCVPIKSTARNEVSGAFQLLNKAGNQNFTDDDLALAEEVADHLQREVDAIYLDQEIFGLTEDLYTSLKRVSKFFIASVALLFLISCGVLALWVLAPIFLG